MITPNHHATGTPTHAAAWLSVAVLGLAILLAAGAGPAYRLELLSLREAFSLLRYGVYCAIAASALGLLTLLIGAWQRRPAPAFAGALALAISLGIAYVPYSHWRLAQSVPPIHDITTDTDNPPAFIALAQAREAAPNAVDHPGEATARQQHAAYPDIAPLFLQADLSTVREAARAQVASSGWTAAEISEDGIEATATTRWFGFKDDVVIRMRVENGVVRVDMRSASRVGRSDVGANAARIRAYLKALDQRVAAQ